MILLGIKDVYFKRLISTKNFGSKDSFCIPHKLPNWILIQDVVYGTCTIAKGNSLPFYRY